MKRALSHFRLLNIVILSLSTLLLSLLSFNSHSNTDCQLTIGWEPWRPYQYLDVNEKLIGLDVELISSTIKHMGCNIKYVETPWKRLLISVKEGSIDLVAGASITEKRMLWGYFSKPYRKDEIKLFILKDNLKRYPYDSLTELLKSTSFSIGITRGTYLGEEVEVLLNNPKTLSAFNFVTDETQNAKKLLNKRIDGFLADKVAGSQYSGALDGLVRAATHPMHIYSSSIHLLFSRQSTSQKLVDKFNRSLSILQKNGVHDKILSRYK